MILKTRITNNVNAIRNLRWAGVKGISIGPKETLEFDGGYPTACRNLQCVKQFEAEVDEKLIDVILVTDLPVERIKEVTVDAPIIIEDTQVEVLVNIPKVILVEPKEITPIVEKENISDHLFMTESPTEVKQDIEQGTFSKGPMDNFFKKAFKDKDVIALDGTAGVFPEDRPENAEKAIFKGDVQETTENSDYANVFETAEITKVETESTKAFTVEPETIVKPKRKTSKKATRTKQTALSN